MTCQDCGAELPPPKRAGGRQRKRCGWCRLEEKRRRSREYARAFEARGPAGYRFCQVCEAVRAETVCRQCKILLAGIDSRDVEAKRITGDPHRERFVRLYAERAAQGLPLFGADDIALARSAG